MSWGNVYLAVMTKAKTISDTMVKTIKCPVTIEDPDKAQRIIKYRALRQIARECRYLGTRALELYIGMVVLPDSRIGLKDGEEKKPDNTRCYRVIQGINRFVPANVIANLTGMVAAKAYRNAIKDARAGRKSFPTFTSEFIPVPVQGTVIRPSESDPDQYEVLPNGFAGKWLSDDLLAEITSKKDQTPLGPIDDPRLTLKTIFQWKHASARAVLDRIVKGQYKACDSKLKFDGRKLWLCLSYKFVKEPVKLDPAVVCGVDLGYVTPYVCALNSSLKRLYSPIKGSDIMAKRTGFANARRRRQKLTGNISRSVKWDPSAHEVQWAHTLYHALTRQVINFALANNAGTIHIEDLSGLRRMQTEAKDNQYARVIWVPSKFRDLLTYKAEEVGIRVEAVDPRNTSRRCHRCGHIDKNNRKTQADFACISCGYKCHADYNAARNIATLQQGQSYAVASHHGDD